MKKAEQQVEHKTFTIDGENYRFRVKQFKLNGRVVTEEEALKDISILTRLVEMQSGLIKQIF